MQQQQQQQAAQEDQRKQMLLAGVLDNGARSRLSSVALVKPERARMIENQIIQMVQSGRVQGQLGEETIVGMLKQIGSAQEKKAAVKFHLHIVEQAGAMTIRMMIMMMICSNCTMFIRDLSRSGLVPFGSSHVKFQYLFLRQKSSFAPAKYFV